MSFQQGRLELTLADVLQIVRSWLREGELVNAHIRIGQSFGELVREQVLFAIDVVQVALPADDAGTGASPEFTLAAGDLPVGELSPYDRLAVVGVTAQAADESVEPGF